MVWNSAGSTLYKAVERHNSVAEQHSPQPTEIPQADKSLQSEEAPQSAQTGKAAPDNRVHTARQQSGYPFQAVIQDKDMLLIMAVILLLLHEKADTKLILALAFVIFC